MKFRFAHNNLNVLDLEKSAAFYAQAFGLKEVRRKETVDFVLLYLGDGQTSHELELTWLKARKEKYNLSFMKEWTVFVMKIKKWEYILCQILTDTGWK